MFCHFLWFLVAITLKAREIRAAVSAVLIITLYYWDQFNVYMASVCKSEDNIQATRVLMCKHHRSIAMQVFILYTIKLNFKTWYLMMYLWLEEYKRGLDMTYKCIYTVFTRLSAAALFKFPELQMQRSFEGGALEWVCELYLATVESSGFYKYIIELHGKLHKHKESMYITNYTNTYLHSCTCFSWVPCS